MTLRILIVEDDADTRQALQLRLRAVGYQTLVAADGTMAIQTARRERPDLVLLDLGLPGGDGFTVLRSLKQLAPLAGIPVIVFSARDPAVYRERALQAGAEAFLPKPLDNAELLAALSRYTPRGVEAGAASAKVLMVEDDTDTRRAIAARLRASGYEVVEAADSVTGVSIAIKERPAVVLLDLGLPGGDGFVFLERLKLHPALAQLPVIVLSAWDPESYKERVLRSGATAFIEKPPDNEALLEAIRRAASDRDL